MVQWNDEPAQQLRQTHPQTLAAVRGLREPLAAAHRAPSVPRAPAAAGEGSGPSGPHDQPAAVPPEDPDQVPVEAPLCLALPRTRGRLQAQPAGEAASLLSSTETMVS